MARSCLVFVDLLLLLLVLSQGTTAGVVDNVSDGLKLAGQMFGINTAADVANLVAKAFSRATTRNKPDLMNMLHHGLAGQQDDAQEGETEQTDQAEQETEPENAQETPPVDQPNRRRPLQFNSIQMLSNIMNMIGFDPRKLGALAINAILMIAQAIGTTIVQTTRGPNDASTGPEELFEPSEHQPRELSAGDPIDWFMQRPGTHSQRMLRRIMDRELPEHIVDILATKETPNGNETACMKLLICKSTPIIWGMQNSLKKRLAGEPVESDAQSYMNANAFFKHLPSISEYKEHGVGCEERFGQQCPRNLNLTEVKNFNRKN